MCPELQLIYLAISPFTIQRVQCDFQYVSAYIRYQQPFRCTPLLHCRTSSIQLLMALPHVSFFLGKELASEFQSIFLTITQAFQFFSVKYLTLSLYKRQLDQKIQNQIKTMLTSMCGIVTLLPLEIILALQWLMHSRGPLSDLGHLALQEMVCSAIYSRSHSKSLAETGGRLGRATCQLSWPSE